MIYFFEFQGFFFAYEQGRGEQVQTVQKDTCGYPFGY